MDLAEVDFEDESDYEQLNAIQNRKQKKAGGWQSMGLDHTVFKGVLRKGYRQPTPIQRKAIPLACDGRDVVAMSRTGSGKTAAFVVPMLQRLKRHDTRGIRALLFSPTRELALQTFKTVKELGRFTGLFCACLIGGDSMDEQFNVLHQHPDILIATPGRLLHLVVEMDLKLNSVQFIVFDEGDRLFELGFADQLKEILKRVPDSRQTLLFSATLPKMLVDFAKAGLSNPELVRLDVETKLSDKLAMAFALCRQVEKLPVLLNVCRVLSNQKKKTIIFCATMKHVEHLVAVFQHADLDPAYLYSQLDPVARKQNITRFRNDECFLLVVTDIAARGVDIPLLDYAINYHFPPKPKLFVHRVGRVARAGKSGISISFVSPDEMAYLVDLFLFLGRPMQFVQPDDIAGNAKWNKNPDSVLIGIFPDTMAHMETEFLRTIEQNSIEISDLHRKAENAMTKYQRTRQQPSAESVRRVKSEFRHISPGPHPFFADPVLFPDFALEQRAEGTAAAFGHEVLVQLKNWRPNQAIFELRNTLGGAGIMKTKECQTVVSKQPSRAEERRAEERAEHFVDYVPSDVNTERGLALRGNSDDVGGGGISGGDMFEDAARAATVDMGADDERGMHMDNKRKMWDRKRKKFVSAEKGQQQPVKKMRTEEGTLLPLDFQRPQGDDNEQDQEEHGPKNNNQRMRRGAEFRNKKGGGQQQHFNKDQNRRGKFSKRGTTSAKGKPTAGGGGGGAKGELRNMDQVVKARRKKANIQSYQTHRREENLRKRDKAANRWKPKGARSDQQQQQRGRGAKGGAGGRRNVRTKRKR
uniref:RNA helicase n=1 Tax=Globodera rostochiensis TaxID=31243 RepID=A0A914I2W1_GLORO